MYFLKSKTNWVVIVLVVLLVTSVAANLQAKGEREEVNDMWLSKTVHTLYSHFLPPIYALDEILTKEKVDEAKFARLSEQLHSANLTAGTLSSSSVSPQSETWKKISTSLSVAEGIASEAFSEYEKTGSLSEKNREKLKELEELGMKMVNVLQAELNQDTGIITERGLAKLDQLASEYNQQIHQVE